MSTERDKEVEINFKAFDKIQKFMRDLKSAFGDEDTDLNKFALLTKKTNFDRHDIILKHLDLFGAYCLANQQAIKANDPMKLNEDDLIYNESIKFNLRRLVVKADADSRKVIAKHLQYIFCLLYPDDQLKNALLSSIMSSSTSSNSSQSVDATLSDLTKVKGDETKEEAFCNNLMERIMTNSQPTDNVTNIHQAMNHLNQSNIIDDIRSTIPAGLENGTLDLNNLLKGAFGMFNKVKEQSDDPQLSTMLHMVEGMLNQAQASLNGQ